MRIFQEKHLQWDYISKQSQLIQLTRSRVNNNKNWMKYIELVTGSYGEENRMSNANGKVMN
jgi:hypothetical protein